MFTFLREPFRYLVNLNETGSIIGISIFSFIITTTLLGSLIYTTKAQWTRTELLREKQRLKENQNKFHVRLFWAQIRLGNHNEARRLYNLDFFITGSLRVLCNGILLGVASQINIDETRKEKFDERMNSYLKYE